MANTSTAPPAALPCVWMSAGLISYHLCDHDYDCEHCPLDAALRGVRPTEASAPHPGGDSVAVAFPADRRYCAGHLWVSPGAPHRVGLDAFAAALAGPPLAIEWSARPGARLDADAPLCTLAYGGASLPLAAPTAGRLVRHNPRLDVSPQLAAGSPYEEGWLAEIDPTAEAAATLLTPPCEASMASLRARLDLRHLRHRIAADLLADTSELGPTLPDGGRLVTDLRGLLGLRRWVELLRELVH